jgi:hypothetical protein
MSGTPLALRPVLPIAAEETYSHCLEALGIQNLSPEDQLKEVVHGPMSTLWAYIPPAIQLLPIIDNETVFEGPTYQALHAGPKEIEAILPGIRWCRRILLGDCKSDVSRSFSCVLMKPRQLTAIRSIPRLAYSRHCSQAASPVSQVYFTNPWQDPFAPTQTQSKV